MPKSSSPPLFPLRFDGVRFDAPLKNPNRTTHERCLFKADDFELAAPGKLVILGENGAGKSLFLRLAHGLIQPQQGRVTWQLPTEAAQKKQAMVFQRPVMLRRSVMANLKFAAKHSPLAPAAQDAAIHKVLKRLGLDALTGRAARRLSGGEQQKLAIGRAWLFQPSVLFMDEPTASLDPLASHEIETLIDEIHQDDTQIMLTTHNLGQARRLADQVLFIHHGEIIELTPASQFFKQPQTELAARFLSGDSLFQAARA